MNARRSPPPGRVTRTGARPGARVRGVALIFALLMLAMIGLASAAIMRNATSAGQASDGDALQAQAREAAGLALRWCEVQLTLPASSRGVALQPAATPPAWTLQDAWRPGAAAHMLGPADTGGTTPARVAPQCLLEAAAWPGVYIVTARGFSPDYAADPRSGATRHGAVVWLQATILSPPPAASGPRTSGPWRVWQPLLTPPF